MATEYAATIKTEYGVLMSGGGYHIRWDDPEAERILPIADFITCMNRDGAHVYRRRVVVVEDWEEVTKP